MFPTAKSPATDRVARPADPKSPTARFARGGVKRLTVAGGIAASAVLLFAGTASAHVTVVPQGVAAQGGSAIINFKVPNERDDASTVKLEVNIPADHPLASVMPEPMPGWKIVTTKTKLAKPLELHGSPVTEAVSKITWTADGGQIPPGQFQMFPLSVSPLPEDTDQLVFKTLQTYSNKSVVRWIQESAPGEPEPDNPAPVLKLTAPVADSGHGAPNAKTATDTAPKAHAADMQPTAAAASDTTARVLGIAGIVIGIAGVAFGVLAGRRRTT